MGPADSISRRAALSAFTFALVVTAAPAGRAAPTLRIDFDHGLRALDGRGKPVAAQVIGTLDVVDTDAGAALRSGPGFGYLQLPTRGIVSARAGTVEMWISPVDWNGDEQKFHVFFQAQGEGGALYLYKYYLGNLLMLTCQDTRAGPYASAGADMSSWQPRQWHHVAGTWSSGHVRLYVDGKRVSEATPLLPLALDSTFLVGDHPWHIPRTSSSLIRAVRIYDRALSDAELSAHARADDLGAAVGAESFDLSFAVDARRAALTAIVQLEGEPAELRGGAAELRLLDERGAVRAAARAPFHGTTSAGRLSLARLPPARYQLSARIWTRGRPAMSKTLPVEIPDTRWQGNRLGALASVPPPWSPLQVHRQNDQRVLVDAYARQYEFAGSALPRHIRAQGEELLAAPLQLVLQVAGRRLSRTALRRFEVTETTTATTIHSSERVGNGNISVEVDTHTRLEYDGLLVVDLEVVAPRGKTIDGAVLEVPVRTAIARYRHRAAYGGEGHAGLVPESGEQDRFIPYAWIGDDQRGLFWFCESDEHWPDRDAHDAYAIVRDGATTAMRFTIAAAHPLPARWRFRFGLQATPVKPAQPRLEPWRLAPAAHSNIAIIWPKPEADSLRYYGYPEPMDATRFQQRIAAEHARGQQALVYSCLTCLSTQSPEYTWFAREWSMAGGDATSSDVLAYGAGLAALNPLARSLADFLVYKNLRLLETFGVDGFYHDNTIVYPCTAGRDGCGYRDRSGRIHPTFPILAYRDLYRRLYVAVKSRWPDTRLIAHASGNIIVPILAYEDAYLDGETFRARVQRSYADVLPLEQFRTEFVGAHFGLRSLFLPEFAADQAEQLAPSRQLAALLLVHDVPAWPVWANARVFDVAYAALDDFGASPQTFVPYYDPSPLATAKEPGVYVSGYRRADGRSLLIVSNLSADRHQVHLELDARRFRDTPLRASVVPAGPVLAVRHDTMDLALAAGDFQIISVQPIRVPLP